MTLNGARCQCAVVRRVLNPSQVVRSPSGRAVHGPEVLRGFAMETLGMVQRQVGEESLWAGPRMPLEALTAATRRRMKGWNADDGRGANRAPLEEVRVMHPMAVVEAVEDAVHELHR